MRGPADQRSRPIVFDTVASIARTLPAVDAGTEYHGSPVLKVSDSFVASLVDQLLLEKP